MSRPSAIFLRPSTSALCCLLFALAQTPAFAQQLDQSELPTPLSDRAMPIRFENLGIDDGLSMSVVMSIHQDRYGFMWFGTQHGINRFDGHEFKIYQHVPFDSTSFREGWVTSISEDTPGNLWITTRAGLDVMDRVSETFTHYDHDPDDPSSIASTNTWDAAEDRNGVVWVGTSNGLDRFDPETGGFEHFRHDSTDHNSLSANTVPHITVAESGDLWFSTTNGISIMDPDSAGQFRRLLFQEDVPFFRRGVLSTFERPNEPGVIWALRPRELLRVDAETGEAESFPAISDGGEFSFNFSLSTKTIVQDPINRNVLWIGSFGEGLIRFDIRTKTFLQFRADTSNPNSLAQDGIEAIYADRTGVIWVGNQGSGVDRFSPASVGVAHMVGDASGTKPLPGSHIWGVLESSRGELWVATEDLRSVHRVTRLDRATGKATHYEHDPDDPHSLEDGGYFGIMEDREGTIWVYGEVGAGVSRYDARNDRFIRFDVDPNDPTKLPTGRVPRLIQDASGTIWSGTSAGLSRYDPDIDGFSSIAGDPDDANRIPTGIDALGEDQSGTIWLGSRRFGLASYDPVTEQVRRFRYDPNDPSSISSNSIQVIHERRREPGIMWVGTSGGGLNRLDIETGKFRSYTVADGMPDNVIYGFLEDETGRLWISTNRGLSRFTPETDEFRNYGLEIGLQALEFNGGSYFRSSSGEMFFGGIDGLNSFFPSQLTENTTPPEVALVDLKLFNESITKSGIVDLKDPLPETKELILDYSQKEISFDFVALHFENPENNEFAYMLEGFNEDWVMSGQRRTATFTNLAPGDYTFKVKAANSDGVWNEEGTSIQITIMPPFWATWWFRAFGFLAIAGVLYGGFRLRVRQIAERNRVLEGEVAMRTAELSESNERLGLTNDQLEQSHTMVQAINQETSFRTLLTKILEEARVIPGVEKATAIVLSGDGKFHVRASSGWNVSEMEHIGLTPSEAHQRYIAGSEELAEDIFVAKNVAGRSGAEQMAEFGQVASFLVLRIRVDASVSGYLVFDNTSDPGAFDQRDVDFLERLREHIQSAFIKTRILEDLQNTLDDLKSTQDRLVQSAKMASLGQLTAGIAHEIKNPLNFVNNFSDVTAELSDELAVEIEKLKADLPADRLADIESILEGLSLNAKKIREHGRRADGIVENMLEHSKSGEGERTPTDINDLLGEYLVLAQHGLRAQEGDFEVLVEQDMDDSIGRVNIVPQEMGRVFMNLISNAFDALRPSTVDRRPSDDAPTLTVSTHRDDANVEIRISDNGPGIPDDVKSKIFEPFFTTKPTGSGTGLGLSMSYDIVTKGHNGSLEVDSIVGEGATFIIRLPV